MATSKKDMGTIVAEAMERRGIRAADLARETGVPAQVISHIIHNRKGTGADYAERLGMALGLAPAVFDKRAYSRARQAAKKAPRARAAA